MIFDINKLPNPEFAPQFVADLARESNNLFMDWDSREEVMYIHRVVWWKPWTWGRPTVMWSEKTGWRKVSK